MNSACSITNQTSPHFAEALPLKVIQQDGGAAAGMLRDADFSFDVQDHDLYVVTPNLQGEWTDPPLGMAYVYAATPGTPAPDPRRSPVHQGWKRLDANHPMVKWLVSLSHMEI